ncbi:hypothetical protein NL676_006936 [Syzygium grande]|nr:hypothetical protein NL676_006936 [Syzygium grande]
MGFKRRVGGVNSRYQGGMEKSKSSTTWETKYAAWRHSALTRRTSFMGNLNVDGDDKETGFFGLSRFRRNVFHALPLVFSSDNAKDQRFAVELKWAALPVPRDVGGEVTVGLEMMGHPASRVKPSSPPLSTVKRKS